MNTLLTGKKNWFKFYFNHLPEELQSTASTGRKEVVGRVGVVVGTVGIVGGVITLITLNEALHLPIIEVTVQNRLEASLLKVTVIVLELEVVDGGAIIPV